MDVIQVNTKHIDDAERWAKERNETPMMRELYEGALGFAIDGIAAVWLYPTHGPLALLENLSVNPEVSKEQARAATDAVVGAAMERAHRLGCKYVSAVTSSDAVAADAERLGFRVVGKHNQVLVAETGGGDGTR